MFIRKAGVIFNLCRACEAWVGVHEGTDKALGRLANKELRSLKINAHSKFDKLWKQLLIFDFSVKKARNFCYAWLADKMNLPIERTHIGMFDEEQCKSAIKHVKQLNFEGGISKLVTQEKGEKYSPEQIPVMPKQENDKDRYLNRVRDELEYLANELQITVSHLTPTQIRLSDHVVKVDIYPVNRKYHNLTTNKRGNITRFSLRICCLTVLNNRLILFSIL